MSLVRKYKISKITNISLEGRDKETIDFIESWLNDLIPFKYNYFPEHIFYMNKKGLCVFEYDPENNHIWFRYEKFWKVLHLKYEMLNIHIKDILQYMIDIIFNSKNIKVLESFRESLQQSVESTYKK